MHSYRILVKGWRALAFMLPFLVGMYMGDEDNNDQRLCVVEHNAIIGASVRAWYSNTAVDHVPLGSWSPSSYAGCILFV